jgi:hypothetical protein
MNAKTSSLFAGIALLAGVGIANAEERLTAASMDSVTAGWYTVPNVSFYKDINTNVNTVLNVDKTVSSDVYVSGKLADAEASASCSSYNCVSETLTVTNTGYHIPTTAYSSSLSASH